MKRAAFLVLTLAVLYLCAQDAPPIRVSVNLVQIDAVVTDRQGHPVRNLTKDDFELFEDGHRREITHFSYVRLDREAPAATQAGGLRSRSGPDAPVLRENIHRTVAMLVDDLQMSFTSIHHTREALKKFVDQQMSPGDLIAIIPTSGGANSLQQFTTDKRVLHAAIDHLRFALNGVNSSGSINPLGVNTADGASDVMAAAMRRRFAVGTLGAIRYVTRGMQDMPGRKSLVLFSDGFPIHKTPRREPPVDVTETRRVVRSANESSVVIYSVDARALVYPGIQAQDTTLYATTEQVMDLLNDRQAAFRANLDGPSLLAVETGGLVSTDTNNPNTALDRMLEDQSSVSVQRTPVEREREGC